MSRNMFCFFFVLGVTVGGAFGKTLDYTKNNNEGSNMFDDGIVGGHSVDITQHPYQVAVLLNESFYCGGSIISESFVLTAAHCCENEPKFYSVRIGSTYNSKDGTVYNVLKHITHPKYNEVTIDFDVALMQIPPMKLDGVTSKAVQLADSQSSLKPGQNTIVTGWGRTQPLKMINKLYSEGTLKNGVYGSAVLQAVTVPVVSQEVCSKAYEPPLPTITDNMVCAGLTEGGKDACKGDSGGPLVAEVSLVQYGIVSFGDGCARPNVPGVYAYIPRARDWIKEISGI